jgi:uncharacterized protein
MPEYLAPGVYVEETSFRSRSIEGVSTTTTGFIGPTRYGPVEQDPDIITSLGEFERTYGDGEQLRFGDLRMDNFTWHAARAFSTEGGKRLYVSRVFRSWGEADVPSGMNRDGRASRDIGDVRVRARYPGRFGNFMVRVTARSGRNILGRALGSDGQARPTLGALNERDIVWMRFDESPSTSPGGFGDVYQAIRDPAGDPFPWAFTYAEGADVTSSPMSRFSIPNRAPSVAPGAGPAVRVIALTIEVLDEDGQSLGIWTDVHPDPRHRTGGIPDSLYDLFADDPEASGLPIVVSGDRTRSGLAILEALFEDEDFSDGEALEAGIIREVQLTGGNDGDRPGAGEYEGAANPDTLVRTGLKQFEALEDISIVAAPGSTWNYSNYRDDANTVIGLLLAHAREMKYCIAVIDSAQNQSISDVRKMRAKLDSKYGALYYPWVQVQDPITRRLISLPPSGFVAGVYARNDITRAVYKAPANEVVNLALGFELLLTRSQQEVLNPEGINCFRYFEGRGMLVWGARTISSDPEWKYVNLRRYFAYLGRSIDRGTQWAVFEPNGERLWANVRRTVSDFLLNEWQMGALLGDKPEKAYFVKCDRTTMTQNDLDNGRLVCLVGVAALKPAEFVIFRIGQWTADHKV